MPLRKWHRTETRVEPRKKRGSIFTCARSEFVRYLLNRRLRRLERRERGVPNLQAQETEKDRDVREKTKPEHSGMAKKIYSRPELSSAGHVARRGVTLPFAARRLSSSRGRPGKSYRCSSREPFWQKVPADSLGKRHRFKPDRAHARYCCVEPAF